MLSHSLTIAKFTLLESLRNKLLWLVMLVVVSGFGLAEFIADLAITDSRKIQVAILSSSLRISGVVVMALVVVTAVMREQQDKTLELILALSVHRSSYFFGKLLGFSIISLSVVAIFTGLLLFYADGLSVLFWGLSFFCELLLVVCLSLVMLFTFRQIPAALTTVFLFYVLARSLASMQLIAENPIMKLGGLGQQFINGFIDVLAWLLPSLHNFSRSEWLVYGNVSPDAIIGVIGQTLVYLVFLCGIALFDFYRKNFSL